MYIFLLQFYLISHSNFILFFIIIVFFRSLSRFVHSSKFILNFVFQSSKAQSGCAGHCRCRRTKRFQQLSRRIVLIIVTSCRASVHPVVSESLTQIPLNAGVTSPGGGKASFRSSSRPHRATDHVSSDTGDPRPSCSMHLRRKWPRNRGEGSFVAHCALRFRG